VGATSSAGKPLFSHAGASEVRQRRARRRLCPVSGKRRRKPALLPDGSIHIAAGMEPGKSSYTEDRLLLSLSLSRR